MHLSVRRSARVSSCRPDQLRQSDQIACGRRKGQRPIADEVNKLGRFDVVCAELCGLGPHMQGVYSSGGSTANLVGCIPCVEPIYKNIYVKSNKEGEFVVVNKYLIEDLKARGLWSLGMLNRIKYADGSIQDIHELPADLRAKYKEVFEIDGRWLVRAAAAAARAAGRRARRTRTRSRWPRESQSLEPCRSPEAPKRLPGRSGEREPNPSGSFALHECTGRAAEIARP